MNPNQESVKLVEVVVDEVGEPRNDRTPGSALYAVPFKLSRIPSLTWTKFFIEAWNRPPRFTSMHRPGIARVVTDRIILDGTTIEEVERYHLETLKLAVEQANQHEAAFEDMSAAKAKSFLRKSADHRKHVADVASRLKL